MGAPRSRGAAAPQHVADLADVASIPAAVTSTNGVVSASRTTAWTPGRAAASRITERTWSAFAKNSPASTRSTTTPSGCWFSGWRATSPHCSGSPRTRPSTATCGRDAR